MNPFYLISEKNQKTNDRFQLSNLGETVITALLGTKDGTTQEYRRTTTQDDYDREFVTKLMRFSPVYDIEQLLDYHFDFYLKTNGKEDTFIKHIKYVIIPIVERRYEHHKVQVELINEWIIQKKPSSLSVSGIIVNGNNNNIISSVSNSNIGIE